MTDPDALEQRVNELEALIAHQDIKLDEMSDTIAGQWTKLDELARKNRQLNDRLLSLEGDIQSALPADKPPPHY